jgi:hypothetical protein
VTTDTNYNNISKSLLYHVPPQYSITGAYPGTLDINQRAVMGSLASPVELNLRILLQSQFLVALHACQDLTREGTTPNIDISASSTNSQKDFVEGMPLKRQIEAPLISWNSSHGPIIQPILVGQFTLSPILMSW